MRGQWDEADIRRSRTAYPRHLPGAAGQRLHGNAGWNSRRRRRSRRASDGNCDVGVLLRLCDRVRALQGHHPAQRSHPRFRGVRGDCRDRGPGARSLLPPSAMDDLPAHDGLRLRRPFCRNRKLAQRQINARDPGQSVLGLHGCHLSHLRRKPVRPAPECAGGARCCSNWAQ